MVIQTWLYNRRANDYSRAKRCKYIKRFFPADNNSFRGVIVRQQRKSPNAIRIELKLLNYLNL